MNNIPINFTHSLEQTQHTSTHKHSQLCIQTKLNTTISSFKSVESVAAQGLTLFDSNPIVFEICNYICEGPMIGYKICSCICRVYLIRFSIYIIIGFFTL